MALQSLILVITKTILYLYFTVNHFILQAKTRKLYISTSFGFDFITLFEATHGKLIIPAH